MLANTRETLFSTLVFLLGSSCSIICGCDWGEPGQCIGAGGMFGACNTTQCGPGLLCWGTSVGSVCAPRTGFADEEAEVCGMAMGENPVLCLDGDVCVVPCANDSQCINGAVCSVDKGFCVHPYIEK